MGGIIGFIIGLIAACMIALDQTPSEGITEKLTDVNKVVVHSED